MATPKKIKTELFPDGSVKCTPLEYTGREELPIEEDNACSVAVALHDCQATPSQPEYSDNIPRCTGRYEGKTTMLCVNQAGWHLEFWYSEPEDNKRRLYHYAADIDWNTGFFRVHAHEDRSRTLGWINPYASGGSMKIRLWWEAHVPQEDDVLERFDERATASLAAMQALRDLKIGVHDPYVESNHELEHLPLRNSGLEYLRDSFHEDTPAGKELVQALQNLFVIRPHHSNENRSKIQIGLDDLEKAVWKILQDSGFRSSSEAWPVNALDVHNHLSDRVAANARILLGRRRRTLKIWSTVSDDSDERMTERHTLYEWFQRALHYDKTSSGAATGRPWIRHGLGVNQSDGFEYELEIKGEGWAADVGIPLGKKASKLFKKVVGKRLEKLAKRNKWAEKLSKKALEKLGKKIEKMLQASTGARHIDGTVTIRGGTGDAAWEQEYGVLLGLASGGSDSGGIGEVKYHARGRARTEVEWKAQSFPGFFAVTPGLQNSVGRLGTMVWILEGSGTDASIQIVWDDVVVAKNMQAAAGHGFGQLFRPEDLEKAPTPEIGEFVDYAKIYQTMAASHFRVGSATVREEGRHTLRTLAALELARFRESKSSCVIQGFADRLGARWFNDILSYTRAENCLTALRDCLDSDFRSRVTLKGFGERTLEALDAVFDFPDEKAEPEWRRVFVVLDGVVGTSLWVPDRVKKPESP